MKYVERGEGWQARRAHRSDATLRHRRLQGPGASALLNPPLLQGLTILYRYRPPLKPEIISLTPGRGLRETEFDMIQRDVNISSLTAFLSPIGIRVGETWEIPTGAVQIVSGRMPETEGYDMSGTLEKVSKSEDGKSLVAQIGVAGHFNVDGDPTAFNARIDFVFVPRGVSIPAASASATAAQSERVSKTLEATGWIKQAFLAHLRVMNVPESEGRLKHRVTFELIMERRPLAPEPGSASAPSVPLPLQPPPTVTHDNSWITYDDPAGRFQFRHPQELTPNEANVPNPYTVDLGDIRPNGIALLGLELPSPRGDLERDKRFLDAAHFQKSIEKVIAPKKDDMTWGVIGWLDDQDWKERKAQSFPDGRPFQARAGSTRLHRLLPGLRSEQLEEFQRRGLDGA